MKPSSRRYLFGLGALLLLSAVIWSAFVARSAPPRLAVALVGIQNEPISHWHKAPTVLNGGRGLCAIFAVTNLSRQDPIWFNTWAVEQKVGAEWRRTVLPPYAARASGGQPSFLIDSDDVSKAYPPGMGWYYVVPWPAGVPTNAVWRLEVRYGKTPSALSEKISRGFGFTKRLAGVRIINQRRAEGTLMTPEVRPVRQGESL